MCFRKSVKTYHESGAVVHICHPKVIPFNQIQTLEGCLQQSTSLRTSLKNKCNFSIKGENGNFVTLIRQYTIILLSPLCNPVLTPLPGHVIKC